MAIEQVRDFHIPFGHPVADSPQLVDSPLFELRRRLIIEELKETIRDYHKGDMVKMVDGFADLLVVINGAILVFGGLKGVQELYEYDYSYFGDYYENDISSTPVMPELEDFVRFSHFMFKEMGEVSMAFSSQNVYRVLSGLIKMRNLVLDMFEVYDIPLEAIENAVHNANMSKLGEDGKPIYREDGKILKGPNFRPPEEDIERILKEHGAQL